MNIDLHQVAKCCLCHFIEKAAVYFSKEPLLSLFYVVKKGRSSVRERVKAMTSRRARHEWSLKRKALAVTLSVALLGLGTPAVSFADSTTDQQSKAVEAQETTSAVYTQDQAPASAKPVQQVAVLDNDAATKDEGLANDAVAPASSENVSGAALKSEAPAPASNDDQPSGKESASTESASKDATPASEAKHDESNGGYYVYLYTKVVGNTKGLTLEVNGNGWYTIGRVWVEGISNPAQGSSTSYVTSGDDYNKVISALKDPSNVDLYGVNNINLEDIEWSVKGQSTGLKTASGAIDYDTSNNPTWHLDGYVDLDKVGFGSVVFHYVDSLNQIKIADDKKVTAKVTGKYFDFSQYIISIEGYTYDHAKPLFVKVVKNSTQEVTFNYNRLSKRQIEMQAKSGTAPYSGQEQSVSGFESNVFEFDGVKYTVSGLTASATGINAGTYVAAVGGTAVVKDAEGNDVTAQFDVTAQPGELVIAKRDVTLKPADAEKPYDGKPLTASSFVVTAGSFAEGEGVESCAYAGSQTLVGESASSIESATALEGTDLETNYNVSYGTGVLKVTDRAEKYAIEMQAKSGTAPYSGQDQSVSGFESNVFEFDGVKYTVSGLTASATGINAGTYVAAVGGTAVVKDAEGNDVTAQFDVTAQPGELVIAKRDVTLKPADAEKPYDGKPLTAPGKIGGLLEGETANLKVTGSQTKVGTSENTYAIEWTGTAKESNYKLESESIGTLTVTAAPDSPTPDDQSKDQGIFNGNDANSGLVQTGDATGIYGMAAIIAAVVAAFVSLHAVRRRKK